MRSGRSWKKVDLLKDPAVDDRFPFEFDPIRSKKEANSTLKPTGADGHLWGELTWRQARARIKKMDVALLPVGSVEQHGPHLPLDTDAFDADYLARRVAEACSDPKPLVLPLISYGVSYHHADFVGTVSVSNDTLARMIYEIGMSVSRNGIRKLVIINGHGGNSPALNYAAQMINRDAHIFVCVDSGETSDVDIYKIVATPNDVHAGEIETSTALAARPELVQIDRAKKHIPKFSSKYLDFTSKRSVLWYAYTRKISTSGVMGDPTKASVAKGEKIWETMIAHLVSFVEDLKRLTLEEIHHRNY
jgi:creatinine amidohydrolase/Fe(II)-dependent formamide hydrolase-like protein